LVLSHELFYLKSIDPKKYEFEANPLDEKELKELQVK
jgi:hypothetical protein